jgi:hypothetical protein
MEQEMLKKERAARRDQFAAAALTGMLASWTADNYPPVVETSAIAFQYGEAMLQESESYETGA